MGRRSLSWGNHHEQVGCSFALPRSLFQLRDVIDFAIFSALGNAIVIILPCTWSPYSFALGLEALKWRRIQKCTFQNVGRSLLISIQLQNALQNCTVIDPAVSRVTVLPLRSWWRIVSANFHSTKSHIVNHLFDQEHVVQKWCPTQLRPAHGRREIQRPDTCVPRTGVQSPQSDRMHTIPRACSSLWWRL